MFLLHKKATMLKQKNNKKTSRNLILLIVGILITTIAVFGILNTERIGDLFHRSNNAATASKNGPTAEQKQTEDATNADNKQRAANPDTPQTSIPPVHDGTAQSIELSAKQEANNSVTIYTKLFNFSGGNCNLTVTNNATTVTKTAPVIYQSEFSSCAGFSVPASELGVGTWQISLQVVSGELSKTQTLSFKVN